MQTFLETPQNLSTILETATREGAVRIRRQDGKTFLLRPEISARSPLDVPGVDLDISTAEIVAIIREGRER